GFSRFPVLNPDGELAAYIHLKDVLEITAGQEGRPVHRKWFRPLVTVQSDQSLRDTLAVMQGRGAHMARVVDVRDGHVLGVATLEDVLEELVGDVVDAGQATR